MKVVSSRSCAAGRWGIEEEESWTRKADARRGFVGFGAWIFFGKWKVADDRDRRDRWGTKSQ